MNLFSQPLYKGRLVWQAEIDTENNQWRQQGGTLGSTQYLSDWYPAADPTSEAETAFDLKRLEGYVEEIS